MMSKIPTLDSSNLFPQSFIVSARKNFESEEYSDAVWNYTHALKDDDDKIEALLYRGMCYISLEKFRKATSDFLSVIRLNPDFSPAYFLRAHAYFRRVIAGEHFLLKRVIHDYTLCLQKLGSDKAPKTIYKEVHKLIPEKGVIHLLRGGCYLMLKREDSAFADWKRAKEFGATNAIEENWRNDMISSN